MRRTLLSFVAILLLSGCAHVAAPKAKFDVQRYDAIERVAVLNYRTLFVHGMKAPAFKCPEHLTFIECQKEKEKFALEKSAGLGSRRTFINTRDAVTEAYDHLRGKLEAELGWTSPDYGTLKRNTSYEDLSRSYHESRPFSTMIFDARTDSDEAHPLASIYWPLSSLRDAGRNMTIHAPGYPLMRRVRGWIDNGLDDLTIRRSVMKALEVDALYQVRMTVEFPSDYRGPKAIKVWVQAHLSDGSQVEPIWRGKVIETKLSADEFNKDRIDDLMKHANTLIVEAQKQTAVAGFVDDVEF